MFVDFHLDKYFNTTNTKCKFTRGIIPFGGPLEGYKNTGDERREQSNSEFMCDTMSRHGIGVADAVERALTRCADVLSRARLQRSRSSSWTT